MRVVEPGDVSRGDIYYLLNSIVVPRPIAWVSTLGADGVPNIAPHSYTTVASVAPPMLLFVSMGDKDTVRNVRDTGTFVINVVDGQHAAQMNTTAADAPPGVSEFELAGLTPVPSLKVAAPRCGEAPVSIECELDRVIDLGSDPSHIVLGRVVALHVEQRLYDEKDRVDPARLDAIARMGGATYSTTHERFDMKRPSYADLNGGSDGNG